MGTGPVLSEGLQAQADKRSQEMAVMGGRPRTSHDCLTIKIHLPVEFLFSVLSSPPQDREG